ncbi:hypothetical protein [Paenibacillus pinihumi]|uniref:hypothetical protein n=1 Tax=Paenibacillus pinihumi TaxID=669462 RepID=UPI0004167D39|nr:hypothetical protein [Paenibacillus pinihumi]
MTKSTTTTSFRLDDDFLKLLDAWAFVTKREKGALLQEAFQQYVKLDQNSTLAAKVKKVSDILSG